MHTFTAYKSARKTGPCLHFLDIEQPNAPQHELFREDEKTGLPKKLSQKEHQAKKDAKAKIRRQATPQTGKQMGGKHNHRQARGMTLKGANRKGNETEVSSSDG